MVFSHAPPFLLFVALLLIAIFNQVNSLIMYRYIYNFFSIRLFFDVRNLSILHDKFMHGCLTQPLISYNLSILPVASVYIICNFLS